MLPSGCYDLGFEIEGYALTFLKGVRVAGDTYLDLPALLPEAVLAGRVLSPSGVGAPGVEAFLLRTEDLAEAQSRIMSWQSAQFRQRVITDAEGRFSFRRLPAASVVVAIVPASQEFAPSFSEEIRIGSAEHRNVGDFSLRRSAALALHLDSKQLERAGLRAEGLFLSARPLDASCSPGASIDETFDRAGSAEMNGLASGNWSITLIDRSGDRGNDRGAVVVAETTIDLREGETRVIDLPLRGRLFRGRVGWPDGRFRPADLLVFPVVPGAVIPAQVRDGRFAVFLAPGRRRVEIEWNDGAAIRRSVLPSVHFEGAEEIAIEIPAGEISGSVRDEQGRPVREALVESWLELDQGSFNSTVRADRDGNFRLPFQAAGKWELYAVDAGRRSGVLKVELHARQDLGGLQLVIPRHRTIHFEFVEKGGPTIANLRASAIVLDEAGVPGKHDFVLETNTSGVASIQLPEAPQRLLLLPAEPTANWPALLSRVLELPAGTRRLRVELPVAAAVGRLRLSTPPGQPWGKRDWEFRYLLVDGSGNRLHSRLLQWQLGESEGEKGKPRELPNLAAGSWRLYRTRTPTVLLEPLEDMELLASFELSPGGTYEIVVPQPDEPEEDEEDEGDDG